MESSEYPKAIYIGSVYPWMKLYYIIAFDSFQRQNLRRGQMIKTRAGVEIVIVVSVCCTNLDKSGFNSNQNSSRGKNLCRYALSLAFVIILVLSDWTYQRNHIAQRSNAIVNKWIDRRARPCFAVCATENFFRLFCSDVRTFNNRSD